MTITRRIKALTVVVGALAVAVGVTDAAGMSSAVAVSEPDTTINSGPVGSTTDDTPTFTFSSTEPGTFECRFDTVEMPGYFEPCSSPWTLGPLAGGVEYALFVRAIDMAGTPDSTWAYSGLFVVDGSPPDTWIDDGPTGVISPTEPSFTFHATLGGSTFECKLDRPEGPGTYAACTSPHRYTTTANGPYTFTVRATSNGRTDESPSTQSFTVATAPTPTPTPTPTPSPTPSPAPVPDTSITGGPSGLTTGTAPSFAFTATVAGATLTCKLDTPSGAGSYAACTSPRVYTTTANGAYTFSVRATAPGGTDATPASRSFTVDTIAPDTTITGGPAGATTGTASSFTFSAEAGATFACKLDTPAGGGSYASCTSPRVYTTTARGAYTFTVRATDAAGNTDASPATRSFTVPRRRTATGR
jgi:hypothetical protein